jgi:four helix bundle protein
VSRDHRKLRVFAQADALVIELYAETATFPTDERYGLCAQVRRSAVSIAANIVEGSARRTTREYLHFINMATGSAAETLYLLDVCHRLNLIRTEGFLRLELKFVELLKGLKSLLSSLEPRVQGPTQSPSSRSQRSKPKA